MSSTDQQVPITREFLRNWYKDYPIDPPNPKLNANAEAMDALLDRLEAHADACQADVAGALVSKRRQHPNKIDENLWRNREQCEEIMLHVNDQVQDTIKSTAKDRNIDSASVDALIDACTSITELAQQAYDDIAAWQEGNVERVQNMVQLFLPNDFRSKMLASQRAKGEARKKAEIDAIVDAGGSIEDKYNKLWEQQLDRREQLVQLGNASGMFKMIIKLAAGVPQVLLDFVKTINDDVGPLEETRLTYGPNAYVLTEYSNRVHLVLRYAAGLIAHLAIDDADDQCSDKPADADLTLLALLTQAHDYVQLYQLSMKEYLDFMAIVFEESPFFITPEQAAQFQMENDPESFIEATVDSRSIYEHKVNITAGTTCGYEFKTEKNDIAFSLVYQPGSADDDDDDDAAASSSSNDNQDEIVLIENKRHDAYNEPISGSFVAEHTGVHAFLFDNSFSYFTSKKLSYRIFILDEDGQVVINDGAEDDDEEDEEQDEE